MSTQLTERPPDTAVPAAELDWAREAAATVPSWGARPPPAGDTRANPGSRRRRWSCRLAGLLVERKDNLGQRSIVLALLAAVMVLDQATKWWAWRHASGAVINPGGDPLVGRTVDRWYTEPVPGALLTCWTLGC